MGFQVDLGSVDKLEGWEPITNDYTAKNGLIVQPVKTIEQMRSAYKNAFASAKIDFGFLGVIVNAELVSTCASIARGEKAQAIVHQDENTSFIFELTVIDGAVYPSQVYPRNDLPYKDINIAVQEWAHAINVRSIDLNWFIKADGFVANGTPENDTYSL